MFGFVNRKKLFAPRENGRVPAVVLRNRKTEAIAYMLPATIGRKPDEVDLYIYDPSVSRIHVKLDLYKGRLIAIDCGSTVGTVINGVRLNPNMPYYLDDKASIIIGKVKLKVYINYPVLQGCYITGQAESVDLESLDQTKTLFGEQQDAEAEEDGTSLLFDEQNESDIEGESSELTIESEMGFDVDVDEEAGKSNQVIENEVETEDTETAAEAEELVLETESIVQEPELDEASETEAEEFTDKDSVSEQREITDFEIIPPVVTQDDEESDEIEIMSYGDYELSDKTEILGEDDKRSDIVMLRWNNSPDDKEDIIHISWTPFVVGRTKDRTDYVINAKGISHRHFFIDNTGNDYYITDLNSTNGVFINGVRIKPMARRKISEGDIITVGERDYTFEKA